MVLEIPGYYYDASKNKYFKVEKNHAAASSATWTADAVKRRKLHDATQRESQLRAQLVKHHIRRHVLRQDIVLGGLISRETEHALVAECGRGRPANGDIGGGAWAGGLQSKGGVPFVPSFAWSREVNVPCFWVGGEDEATGTGVAYATLDEETLVGTYINTDRNDRVSFNRDITGSPTQRPQFRNELVRCPQISSIKYHAPTHRILMTSREPGQSCGLYSFSPTLSEDGSAGPRWLLGETNVYQRLSMNHHILKEWLAHQSTPAPASSDLICIIGSNNGLVRVRSNGSMAWTKHNNHPKGTQLPQEIFDVDFQQSNHNVVLAGGRQPRLWRADLRCPETEWTFTKHASSIAHVRSVNPHQVVVAGLQSKMALYDMRFFRQRPNGIQPLLMFPEYKNAAHFHTGWDVCPDMNAVAAAQDDGTVRLFSLATGRRLKSKALDGVCTDTPVKALLFQTMPRERMPSLWVGEGQALKKYSFGVKEFDDEG